MIKSPQVTVLKRFSQSFWFQWIILGFITSYLTSCETRQKKAIRELSQANIEVSGRSLIQAVSESDLKRTALLLEAGVFIGHRNPNGHSALGIAVKNQNINMVYLLLNANADANATYDNRTSILGIAVEQENSILTGLLLASGARTDDLMPSGERILPWAIRMGRLELIDLMMKAKPDPNLKDHNGHPLLHLCIKSARQDLMETLIELGADPNATNPTGQTTLELAIDHGWLDSLPKLVAAGGDPNARTANGNTLLEQAIISGNHDLISLLLKVGANPTIQGLNETKNPLEKSLEQNDPTLLQIFLKNQNYTPLGGWNPWFWNALKQKDLTKMRILLEHGLRPEPQPTGEPSLVESAVLTERFDLVKLLLDYGCPAKRSLHIAALSNDSFLVELLLIYGSPSNITLFPSKDTLLRTSIRLGHDSVAMRLLEYGANPNLSGHDNQSNFHLAIATGCSQTVKYFLDSGVVPDSPFAQPVSDNYLQLFRPGPLRWMLKMNRNPTPLMAAADHCDLQTAKYLIDAGAKISAKTAPPHMWPINFSANRHDVKMMRLFLNRDPYHEERIIEIHLSTQLAFMFNSEGNEIFKTRVSTGKQGLATPKGEYVITNKHREWTSTLYHASMPYFQRLSCGDFGLHQGIVPDYPDSHGCIRIPASKAEKLFNMTKTGDRVRIMD